MQIAYWYSRTWGSYCFYFILFYFSIFCSHVRLMIESDNFVFYAHLGALCSSSGTSTQSFGQGTIGHSNLDSQYSLLAFSCGIMCYSIVHKKMVFHKQQSFTYDSRFFFLSGYLNVFCYQNFFLFFCFISGWSLQWFV